MLHDDNIHFNFGISQHQASTQVYYVSVAFSAKIEDLMKWKLKRLMTPFSFHLLLNVKMHFRFEQYGSAGNMRFFIRGKISIVFAKKG